MCTFICSNRESLSLCLYSVVVNITLPLKIILRCTKLRRSFGQRAIAAQWPEGLPPVSSLWVRGQFLLSSSPPVSGKVGQHPVDGRGFPPVTVWFLPSQSWLLSRKWSTLDYGVLLNNSITAIILLLLSDLTTCYFVYLGMLKAPPEAWLYVVALPRKSCIKFLCGTERVKNITE